jgi:hypothetical protein
MIIVSKKVLLIYADDDLSAREEIEIPSIELNDDGTRERGNK